MTHFGVAGKWVVGGGDGVVGGVSREAQKSVGNDGCTDARGMDGDALVQHAHSCYTRPCIKELSLSEARKS